MEIDPIAYCSDRSDGCVSLELGGMQEQMHAYEDTI
jgi:hypothetical protein